MCILALDQSGFFGGLGGNRRARHPAGALRGRRPAAHPHQCGGTGLVAGANRPARRCGHKAAARCVRNHAAVGARLSPRAARRAHAGRSRRIRQNRPAASGGSIVVSGAGGGSAQRGVTSTATWPLQRPDGQITSVYQKSCQAPFEKIFRLTRREITFTDSPVPPDKGRCARHERAVGCDGRDSVGRAVAAAGRDEPRERHVACRRTALLTIPAGTGRDARGPARALAGWARTAKSCGPDAPRLASSLAEMHPAQPGS